MKRLHKLFPLLPCFKIQNCNPREAAKRLKYSLLDQGADFVEGTGALGVIWYNISEVFAVCDHHIYL